jgi:type II secretory ATPase GspE/PulE/Tfp pilus assembly ATPase PilB-like protein
MYGVRDDASEINIEPQPEGVRVRYCIDGVLKELSDLPEIPADLLAPLVSRIKTMAAVGTIETNKPQDGSIHIQMHDRDFNLRVHTSPTPLGEKVAMRFVNSRDQ